VTLLHDAVITLGLALGASVIVHRREPFGVDE
jgi:hypothetical protein